MTLLERRLDLKLGFACNNRCLFCAQGELRSTCQARPAKNLLEELRAARPGAAGLVLTGGEPTLYRQLLPLVTAARQLGYRTIQLQTNGRALCYPGFVDALVRAGVTEVSPSLHGATATVHDALTQAPGSFAETVAGITHAVRSGMAVVSNSVVTRHNVATLDALVALLAELGVRNVQLAFVHPVGTAREKFDEVVPTFTELAAPLRRARQVARQRGLVLHTEAVPLCILGDMQDLAVESIIPPTTVADLGGRMDYTAWRTAEGKAHGPPCERCTARSRCEGPWREYPQRRGWGELQPL